MIELNKIYNEDCLETLKRMEDKSVDLILTDIPYDGVNRDSNGLRNLDKEDADIKTFDLSIFIPEIIRVCSGSGYVFCGWEQISEIIKTVRSFGLSNRLCVWRKTNPSPMNGQSIWLSGAEFCVYWKNPNAVFNENCKNCVWDFKCGTGKEHPTQKPIELFNYLVRVSSVSGGVVYDPCLGSGTTAVACVQLGRNYIGSEISKKYCEIAEERIRIAKAQTKLF